MIDDPTVKPEAIYDAMALEIHDAFAEKSLERWFGEE
jgi:hypothetical protein